MRQLVRQCTFETNSSSMHSIVIMRNMHPDNLNDLCYTIDVGEYGWETDEYTGPIAVLEYLWTLANSIDVDKGIECQNRMKEWCPNCTFVEYPVNTFEDGEKYFDCPGYIDHGRDYSCYIDEIFKDKEIFASIVLGGLIRTTNDNSDYPFDNPEWLEPENAIKIFYKGN